MNYDTLKCTNLTKAYGKKVALDNVNLTLSESKIVGLLGPNGSGKTTLIKLIAGLLTPTEGEVLVNGQKIGPETKLAVSYLPDCSYLPDYLTVEDLLKTYADFYINFNIDKATQMVEQLNIDLSNKLKQLSKGNKEKIQLILAMSRDADLYLLDEPIGGVDPAARDYILNTILTNYTNGGTILISTHLISDIEKVLDDVVFLKNGEIVLHQDADSLREEKGCTIDEYFREVFKC